MEKLEDMEFGTLLTIKQNLESSTRFKESDPEFRWRYKRFDDRLKTYLSQITGDPNKLPEMVLQRKVPQRMLDDFRPFYEFFIAQYRKD